MEISFLAGSTPDRDKRYTFPETRLLPFEPALLQRMPLQDFGPRLSENSFQFANLDNRGLPPNADRRPFERVRRFGTKLAVLSESRNAGPSQACRISAHRLLIRAAEGSRS
jgi:hypothetical protein